MTTITTAPILPPAIAGTLSSEPVIWWKHVNCVILVLGSFTSVVQIKICKYEYNNLPQSNGYIIIHELGFDIHLTNFSNRAWCEMQTLLNEHYTIKTLFNEHFTLQKHFLQWTLYNTEALLMITEQYNNSF